jgi:hypothetical protein
MGWKLNTIIIAVGVTIVGGLGLDGKSNYQTKLSPTMSYTF